MPLAPEQIKGLRQVSSSHWKHVLASAPHDNYSSSDESELSVSWDAGDENDPLPSQGTPEYTLTMTTHVENLLQRFMSTQTTTLV